MKPSIKREQKLYDALKCISLYMSPDRLARNAEKLYGLQPEEALSMSYENIINQAKEAIRGLRRPEDDNGPKA